MCEVIVCVMVVEEEEVVVLCSPKKPIRVEEKTERLEKEEEGLMCDKHVRHCHVVVITFPLVAGVNVIWNN